MNLYKLLAIGMLLVLGVISNAKAQGITLSMTPTSGCDSYSSGVTVTATATSLSSGVTGVYWSINDWGVTFCAGFSGCHQDRKSYTFTFKQSGIYTFKCIYGGNVYTSDPIDVSVYSNNLEVCDNNFQHFVWNEVSSTWWSGNYITTCSTGVQVQGVETDPDLHTQLYLKANNSVTLSPGFVAERGTIVEARIASNCSANTPWSTTYSSLRNGIVDIENTGSTSIYPNPTSGNFALNLNYSTLKSVDVVVSDLTGNIVYNNKVGYVDSANLNIDLSNKEPGLYLVKIISDSKTEVKKVVVSR
ncbi:T9SS type A sorting domain-containing protein [Sporocytophaga myxococcoides]|nr:T9SS type A sorting domain-containing protein [Sporocytophaga myxococcoides]